MSGVCRSCCDKEKKRGEKTRISFCNGRRGKVGGRGESDLRDSAHGKKESVHAVPIFMKGQGGRKKERGASALSHEGSFLTRGKEREGE